MRLYLGWSSWFPDMPVHEWHVISPFCKIIYGVNGNACLTASSKFQIASQSSPAPSSINFDWRLFLSSSHTNALSGESTTNFSWSFLSSTYTHTIKAGQVLLSPIYCATKRKTHTQYEGCWWYAFVEHRACLWGSLVAKRCFPLTCANSKLFFEINVQSCLSNNTVFRLTTIPTMETVITHCTI